MLKYTKAGMKSVLKAVGNLENVGAKVLHTSRTMASSTSRSSKMAAPFVGTSGNVLSAMGRNPGRTVAGGTVGAVAMYNMGNQRSMFGTQGASASTRQNTMYNRRMRSGQSSAIGGIQPKSMGGYA
jgi:hypothetical protein